MFLLRCICAALYICLFIAVADNASADDKQQPGKPGIIPRYIDNGDGTVTDKQTGLIWLNNADCFGVQTWDAAISIAGKLGNGTCGLTDGSTTGQWRLPSREELAGLINHKLFNSADWLNKQGFSNVQPDLYWSSTGSDFSTINAWYVDMSRGGVFSAVTNCRYHMWPVRGGK